LVRSAFHLPERQRSIQVVLESAWQQLSEAERSIFARLSMFRGGFTLAAAQAVAEATLPSLRQLTQRALLRFDREHERYHVHELLMTSMQLA
jgi:hypothetical protein